MQVFEEVDPRVDDILRELGLPPKDIVRLVPEELSLIGLLMQAKKLNGDDSLFVRFREAVHWRLHSQMDLMSGHAEETVKAFKVWNRLVSDRLAQWSKANAEFTSARKQEMREVKASLTSQVKEFVQIVAPAEHQTDRYKKMIVQLYELRKKTIDIDKTNENAVRTLHAIRTLNSIRMKLRLLLWCAVGSFGRHAFIWLISIGIFGYLYANLGARVERLVEPHLPKSGWVWATITAVPYAIKNYVLDKPLKKLKRNWDARMLAPVINTLSASEIDLLAHEASKVIFRQ